MEDSTVNSKDFEQIADTNNFSDKTLMKTVTKILKVKTLKTYTKTFFTNCILKNSSVKTTF